MAVPSHQLSIPAGTGWTKVGDGPKNYVLKIEEETQDIEVLYALTSESPVATNGGFPLRWWDGAFSAVVKTGDSLWVRCAKATTVFKLEQAG